MNQVEHNRKLGEILKQARDALNEELLSRQTNAYQVWLDSCNLAWQTRGTLLPPNSMKLVYPTENDIVTRALEIYNKLNPVAVVVDAPVVDAPVAATTVIAETSDMLPSNEVAPVALEEVAPVLPNAPVATPETEAEIKGRFSSLLTKWGGQGHY